MFDAIIYVTSENRHSSYLYVGLKSLLKEKFLNTVKLIPERYYHKDRVIINEKKIERINRPYPYSINVILRDTISKQKVIVGFDLQDWDYMFSHHCLKQCQLIFKRAYSEEMIEIIQSEYSNVVIKPFGFTHNIDFDDKKILLISKISQLINRIPYTFIDPHRVFQFISRKLMKSQFFHNKHQSNNLNSHDQLEIPPEYPFVFYQVEYHHWPNNREAEALNQRRADLIKLLKIEFGDRFIGGMFFKTAPKNKFNDCQTKVPYDHKIYLSFVRKATVVISTSGFGNSLPWKLAEYLKYGKCIVSEPVQHSLNSPLKEGYHLEYFFNDQQCIEKCHELLNSNNNNYSNHASIYYKTNIEPGNAIKKCINNAFSFHH